jgi:uncharacterized protein YhfF
MQLPPPIATFWHGYLATHTYTTPPRLDPEPLWQFGDTPDVATRVGQLAKLGIKTATSCLVWELDHDGGQIPLVGDLAIVTDGDGNPLCIIELTEVSITPFNAVDAQFAFDYGENDRTLAQWREESWAYFSACCAAIGQEPSETMPLVCQRFRRIYPDP